MQDSGVQEENFSVYAQWLPKKGTRGADRRAQVLPETLDPVDQRVMVYIVSHIPAHLVGDGAVLAHDGQYGLLKPGNPASFKGFIQCGMIG